VNYILFLLLQVECSDGVDPYTSLHLAEAMCKCTYRYQKGSPDWNGVATVVNLFRR